MMGNALAGMEFKTILSFSTVLNHTSGTVADIKIAA
jgi:hypothetical protein